MNVYTPFTVLLCSVFIPLSFDSGGVTTGPVTVPFIMALGVGIASAIGGKNRGENSFGLVALCSIGPILAVMFLSLLSKGDLVYAVTGYDFPSDVGAFFALLGSKAAEVFVALFMIIIFFIVLQITVLKLPKEKVIVKQASEADELGKYKELLDKGVITQEEFDAKKKQLLGL